MGAFGTIWLNFAPNATSRAPRSVLVKLLIMLPGVQPRFALNHAARD